MKAPDILAKAESHMRDRAATYDKPEGERSMARAVAAFNAIHGTDLTVAQGWHFMAVLKQVRLFTRPGYDADSLEDLTAYCALLGEEMSSEPAIPTVAERTQEDTPPEETGRPWQVGDLVYFRFAGELRRGQISELELGGQLKIRCNEEDWFLYPSLHEVKLVEEIPYADPYGQPARG